MREVIRMLRAQGRLADADELEVALEWGSLRMGDSRAMGNAGMAAARDGTIYINGNWFRKTKSQRGGITVIASFLIHEAIHRSQFDTASSVFASQGKVWWDDDANEVTAYDRQIDYLLDQLHATNDPRLIFIINAAIREAQYWLDYYRLHPNPGRTGWVRRWPKWADRIETLVIPDSTQDTNNMRLNTVASLTTLMFVSSGLPASPAKHSSALLIQQTSPTPMNPPAEPDAFGGTMPETTLRAESTMSMSVFMEQAQAIGYIWEIASANAGVVPSYNSSTWTAADYQAALHRPLDAEDLAAIAALRECHAAFKTNPLVAGQVLAQQPVSRAVLLVSGRDSEFTLSYGVNKDMIKVQ